MKIAREIDHIKEGYFNTTSSHLPKKFSLLKLAFLSINIGTNRLFPNNENISFKGKISGGG